MPVAVIDHLRSVMFVVFALGLLSVAAAQQPAQLVIANVRVFTGARVIDRATITVADGKILSIAATPPARATVTIDGTGKTALPGLIDAHVHMLAGITEADTRTFIDGALKERLQAFLRHGVTTVKSASDPTDLILGIRQDLRDGTLAGPRLLVVGPSFTARGGHPASTICRGDAWCRANRAAEVDSEEQARREVRRLAQSGVDAIKVVYSSGEPEFKSSFPKLRLEIVKAIVEEARSLGLPVTAHVTEESMALEVLAAGVSGVEHGPNAPLDSDALARALKSPERSLVPTLATLAARTTPVAAIAIADDRSSSQGGCPDRGRHRYTAANAAWAVDHPRGRAAGQGGIVSRGGTQGRHVRRCAASRVGKRDRYARDRHERRHPSRSGRSAPEYRRPSSGGCRRPDGQDRVSANPIEWKGYG